MKKLSCEKELDLLLGLYENQNKVLDDLRDSFNTLQTRAQLLLGLITICLTITGFSGPRIAESGNLSKVSLILGLCFVLISAIMLILGPLRLQWVTQHWGESNRQSYLDLLMRRNNRTKKYEIASILLLVGLSFYVASVVLFLFSL